jgi:hypothetical protein
MGDKQTAEVSKNDGNHKKKKISLGERKVSGGEG